MSKDQTARVWDAATGKTRHELKGHGSWVEGIALSPDGKQVATAGHGYFEAWTNSLPFVYGRPGSTLQGALDNLDIAVRAEAERRAS